MTEMAGFFFLILYKAERAFGPEERGNYIKKGRISNFSDNCSLDRTQ